MREHVKRLQQIGVELGNDEIIEICSQMMKQLDERGAPFDLNDGIQVKQYEEHKQSHYRNEVRGRSSHTESVDRYTYANGKRTRSSSDEYECKRCGGTRFETKQKGPHTGLYCKDCGSWVTWVHKKR